MSSAREPAAETSDENIKTEASKEATDKLEATQNPEAADKPEEKPEDKPEEKPKEKDGTQISIFFVIPSRFSNP